MQLLIILALLLLGGKNDARNLLSEVKPVLESLGGEEMRQALKNAEEISAALSAVRSAETDASNRSDPNHGESSPKRESRINFPLAPVSAIADKDITYSLSQYIARN